MFRTCESDKNWSGQIPECIVSIIDNLTANITDPRFSEQRDVKLLNVPMTFM